MRSSTGQVAGGSTSGESTTPPLSADGASSPQSATAGRPAADLAADERLSVAAAQPEPGYERVCPQPLGDRVQDLWCRRVRFRWVRLAHQPLRSHFSIKGPSA